MIESHAVDCRDDRQAHDVAEKRRLHSHAASHTIQILAPLWEEAALVAIIEIDMIEEQESDFPRHERQLDVECGSMSVASSDTA